MSSIEASRQIIDSIELPRELEINIRRQSTLKSSLFSARIEGNTATIEEFSRLSSKDQRKREVINILAAINWIQRNGKKSVKVKDSLTLHKLIMDGLIADNELGKFRTEPGAIFNAAGQVIYLSPRPDQIPLLINRLINFTNSSKESFVPIRASLVHYIFEKIHPFLDGNGRVGRLLMQAVLNKGGYGMRGLTSTEEFLDNHREDYYRASETSEKDVTFYLEFMLNALSSSAEIAKDLVVNSQNADTSEFLLPRRAEILDIIRDHKMVNFDMIQRRFIAVNARTLRYDLKKLTDLGLVKKRGSTRGVYYEAKYGRGG